MLSAEQLESRSCEAMSTLHNCNLSMLSSLCFGRVVFRFTRAVSALLLSHRCLIKAEAEVVSPTLFANPMPCVTYDEVF